MINIPTVLILGAGASAHCGYPLGAGLIDRLCNLRGSPELDLLPEDWSRVYAETFLTRLSRSGHYSIDAFLENNREDAPLGKYLIALELKKHENIDMLFPPHDSGWYQYLFNSLLIDGKPRFSDNNLSIITFNYDRSLEAYLFTALKNRFRIKSEDAGSVLRGLPIMHVHGILGEYPEFPYNAQCDNNDLLGISQQIQIIHEISDRGDEFCNEVFQRAHDRLQSAQSIYFLGFGFHLDNIRRFRFFSKSGTEGKLLRATTLGLEALEKSHLIETLSDYGFGLDSFPNSGDCSKFFRRIARLK